MTKQEFLDLGLTEEQAEKAEEASKKELSGFIPKHRFDEINSAKKELDKLVANKDTQLEELKKSAGISEELKTQIEKLQSENKEAAEKYDAKLKEIQINNAISLAINGKVQNNADKLVLSQIDKSKLVLNDSGVVGLKEQLESIKEATPYLFKEAPQQQQQQGFVKVGSQQPQRQQGGKPMSLGDAIKAEFSTQQ